MSDHDQLLTVIGRIEQLKAETRHLKEEAARLQDRRATLQAALAAHGKPADP